MFFLPSSLLWSWLLVGKLLKRLLIRLRVSVFNLQRSTSTTSQLVENLPVREAQEPGSERALDRIEAAGAAPDGEEHLLNQLFGLWWADPLAGLALIWWIRGEANEALEASKAGSD